VIHGSPRTVVDKLVAYREHVGPFGTLLKIGLDWSGPNEAWERGNTGLLVLVLQIRGTTLTALLLWILPILIAIVAVAAMQELTRFHTVLASVSPLALLLMSGILPLELLVPVDPEAEFSALTTGANTGIAFATIQLGLLLARWQQLRRTLR
jgi:hypothetical protein